MAVYVFRIPPLGGGGGGTRGGWIIYPSNPDKKPLSSKTKNIQFHDFIFSILVFPNQLFDAEYPITIFSFSHRFERNDNTGDLTFFNMFPLSSQNLCEK